MNASPSQQHHDTAARDRVPAREQLGLGCGRIVADGTHGSLYVLVNPIYNITMGVPPHYLSIASFVQRLWDAVLDPLFGQFSDNFRSRWGRRRPLLLASILPLALLFGALWWFPRAAGPHALFLHFLLVSLVFYSAHSLFAMPLGGLVIEATDDYHERTRLAGIVGSFGFATQIGSQWLFPLTQRFVPAGAGTAGKVEGTLTGLRWVTGGCVVFFLLAGLVPVFLCRERLYARVTEKQPRTSFLDGLRTVRANGSFMALLCARGIFSFGFNLVGAFGGYMYIFYVYGGDVKGSAVNAAWLGTSFHVAAIVTSLFVFPWLERRVGKRRCLQAAALVLIVDCLSKTVLYQPGHPWLPLFVIVTNGVSNAGIGLMAVAMVGDLADQEEWRTGLRREALYTSMLSWFEKAGGSAGTLITGFLLGWIGFDARLGAQSPHTLGLMKASYVAAPLLGALVTLVCIRGYRLTQDEVYAIKDSLARRRAGSPGGPPPPAASAGQ